MHVVLNVDTVVINWCVALALLLRYTLGITVYWYIYLSGNVLDFRYLRYN